MNNEFDFIIGKCNCTFPTEVVLDDDKSTSSENEEDYFSYLMCNIDENEINNLFNPIHNLLESLRPFIPIYDNRLMDIINLWEIDKFFVTNSGRIPYLLSLPYSYFPMMKKSIGNKDPLCAPSYMSELELAAFTRVFKFNENYMKRYRPTKGGFTFVYDLENKSDIQSIYIYHQRLFYEQLLKERTLNKNDKKVKDNNVEYKIPTSAYEPNSLIKRFSDLFTYVCASFDQIYVSREDDEYIIKKFSMALFSGFHLVLASQGIPLNGLIGETYTAENKSNESIIFVEVKNDKPLKIVYNIRWKGRIIMIDGNIDIDWDFLESKDQFLINTIGINTLKVLNKDNNYKLFTFNLPLRATYKGIVDSINMSAERQMTVDSFVYIKGEEVTGLTVFNQKSNSYMFDKFFGYLNKVIININDSINHGHSFATVIFHNSGLNLESVENVEDLQTFLNSKTEKLEFVIRKNLVVNNDEDRYIQIKHSDFLNGKRIDMDGNLIVEEIKKVQEEESKDESFGHDFLDSYFLSSPKRDRRSQRLKKSLLFSRLLGDNSPDNEFKNLASKKFSLLAASPIKHGKPEVNKNPKRKFQRIFLKFIAFLNKSIRSKSFANYFSPSFVRKILCGSWVNLNFFEINYNSNLNNEMLPIYLKFDKDAIKVHPSSRFNEKKGLRIVTDDLKYYTIFHRIYGNLWDPIPKPLINDTRYREDLLWLLRYNNLIKNKSGDNNARLEAFVNSNKYRELIDTYVYQNIVIQLNKAKHK